MVLEYSESALSSIALPPSLKPEPSTRVPEVKVTRTSQELEFVATKAMASFE